MYIEVISVFPLDVEPAVGIFFHSLGELDYRSGSQSLLLFIQDSVVS